MKLEIGPDHTKGGRGYKFNPRYRPDYDVIYLDINPPGFKCDSPWIVDNARVLPYKSSSVDGIFARHVIEHLENSLQFFYLKTHI